MNKKASLSISILNSFDILFNFNNGSLANSSFFRTIVQMSKRKDLVSKGFTQILYIFDF